MGQIINTRTSSNNKIIYKIELDEKEALFLKNHIKNIHLFSKDLFFHESGIISRGNKGGAKYFSVPLKLKARKKQKYDMVSYQKFETDSQIFFICVAEKNPLV
jgi:hypothetical protein